MNRAKKAEMGQGVTGQVLVAVSGRPAPMVKNGAIMPRQKRVSLPTTPARALADAARVYAEARRGQLHVEDAARLSYALKNCADMHRDHVLTSKVESLRESVERIAKILAEKGLGL